MVEFSATSSKSRILDYLKQMAPFSIVDLGLELAEKGHVIELSRSGTKVIGSVRELDEQIHNVSLEILSESDVEGLCSCSSPEEMSEQWCPHAVAALWRAYDLELLRSDAGFASRESSFRIRTATVDDFAKFIRDTDSVSPSLSSQEALDAQPALFSPSAAEINFKLDCTSDRLGVRVLLNGETMGPRLFGEAPRRALLRMLVNLLENRGNWDDFSQFWYVNASDDIEAVLGIIQEFDREIVDHTDQPISLAEQLLEARLVLDWQDDGVEVWMDWVSDTPPSYLDTSAHTCGKSGKSSSADEASATPTLATSTLATPTLATPRLAPSSSSKGSWAIERDSEVFGTGPFWTATQHQIFRLSSQAARLATLFVTPGHVRFSRSQVGALLESLDNYSGTATKVLHPENQPATEVHPPVPSLDLVVKSSMTDHFASSQSIELIATLAFEYPSPPASKNLAGKYIVYLKDHSTEAAIKKQLKDLGFKDSGDGRSLVCFGDDALDILSATATCFPPEWKVSGLNTAKRGIKFADVQLSVTLGANKGDTDQFDSTSKRRADDDLADGEDTAQIKKSAAKQTALTAQKDAQKDGQKASWFDCHVSLIVNNANLPLSSLFKSGSVVKDRWLRLDNGAFAKVPSGSLALLRSTLGMLDPGFRASNSIRTKLSAAQALGLAGLEGNQVKLTVDAQLRTLKTKLADFQNIKPIKPGKSFAGKLRHYQIDGMSWLNFLHDFDLGGILADEMGLGKTVQTLAFIQNLKETRKKEFSAKHPALIICPTSVLTNWVYEAKRFTPNLKVLALQGPGRKPLFKTIPDHDLVITSYALLRLDKVELSHYQFGYVVLDEAQNIKNPAAATTKAAKGLKAAHRLALTGTPTENRPSELWSILDFLMPGYLGSHEFFRTTFEKPLMDDSSQDNRIPETTANEPVSQERSITNRNISEGEADNDSEEGSISSGRSVAVVDSTLPAALQSGQPVAQMLNSRVRPFILRRTKREVEKDLPPKIESLMHVEMTQSQRELYLQVLHEVRPQVFEAVKAKGIKGATISILTALLRLRQICNHPNSIAGLENLKGFDSGKFGLLKELVSEAMDSDKKILLFSQFREMLKIIRNWLHEEKIEHLYLDGGTSDRQDLVDRFNADRAVRLFLISLKAGGTGLNLPAADTVIIYDPWWNPAVEQQAIDRAHRIGQTKTVNVYRLITENSVEQRIMDLKDKKSKMIDAIINTNGAAAAQLSKSDLEALFSLEG